MKNKFFLWLISVFILKTDLRAQDIHFTQYFTSPLTLNPALTGMIKGNWRAAANFRQQWWEVSYNPYTTGTFSFDVAVLQNKLPEGDAIGIGLLGYYDQSGSGGYKNTTIGFSFAYHKAFGTENRHSLSMGLQGALVQKSLEFSKLHFEDQYRLGIPGSALHASSEMINNSDLTYPDFNVGLIYSGSVIEGLSWYAGASLYHLGRPIESFLSSSEKINRRFTGYLGGHININRETLLYVSSMYQQQGPARELLYGAAFGFFLNPDRPDESVGNATVLYLGAWYRHNDALAPYVGIDFLGFQIGISYDVTLSRAQAMTTALGGLECSIIYDGLINTIKRPNRTFACPRF